MNKKSQIDETLFGPSRAANPFTKVKWLLESQLALKNRSIKINPKCCISMR